MTLLWLLKVLTLMAMEIEAARALEMDTVGFLMMSHMVSTADLVKQAQLMEQYGAQCVYVVDSAGALLMDQTAERIKAMSPEAVAEMDTQREAMKQWMSERPEGADREAMREWMSERPEGAKGPGGRNGMGRPGPRDGDRQGAPASV